MGVQIKWPLLLAMTRRALNRRPLFVGDRSHSYDQLKDRYGASTVGAVLICYLVGIIYGGLGVAVSALDNAAAVAVTAGVLALSVGLIVGGRFLSA